MRLFLAGPGSVVMVALALACGGKSFEAEGGSQGGEAGSSAAGSSSAGTSAGGTGSGGVSNAGTSSGAMSSGAASTGGVASAGSGSGGTAGAASRCDSTAYRDELEGSVPVRLINKTEKPIYLGPTVRGCNFDPLFEVTNASGQPLPSPEICRMTCTQLLTGSVPVCPPVACPIESVVMLQPGGSVLVLWSGLYMESVMLPPVCQKVAGAPTCDRVASAKPGSYVFSAQAANQFTCELNSGCTLCMPDAQGVCSIPGALASGPFLQAKVVVNLDGSYGIGGPGGAGMVREVQITFQ